MNKHDKKILSELFPKSKRKFSKMDLSDIKVQLDYQIDDEIFKKLMSAHTVEPIPEADADMVRKLQDIYENLFGKIGKAYNQTSELIEDCENIDLID